jgi:hypothetical protein
MDPSHGISDPSRSSFCLGWLTNYFHVTFSVSGKV